MRISEHWTRQTITLPCTHLSSLFSRTIEYQNLSPKSEYTSVRISTNKQGNITAKVIPKTHATLCKLIDLLSHEQNVNWSSTFGAATFHAMKNNQSDIFRLFNILVNFDHSFLPVLNDLQSLLNGHHGETAGSRRERDDGSQNHQHETVGTSKQNSFSR